MDAIISSSFSSCFLTHSNRNGYGRGIRCVKPKLNCRVSCEKKKIYFNDPEWKKRYQDEFEERFSLPHLKDTFDATPRPTTFSLSNRGIHQTRRGIDVFDEQKHSYVDDADRALLKVIKYASPTSAGAEGVDPDCSWLELWVPRAGPRRHIYFEPDEVKAAIVSCGGLCPGLNDVIRQLSRKVVQNINLSGGSLLGVSRGGAQINRIVDSIQVG
nr:ATP-dependent 6-phosphofructokinase 5, chloroplastic-like [Ipomoea batatas]